MYRELLTPYLKEYTYAVLQEPCSEETIQKAEKAVGLPFPQELKTLLRETNGDRWLLLSADEIAENAHLNQQCFENAEDDEKALFEPLKHLLLFATNGCGDYYGYLFTNDGSVKDGIYLWEHEDFRYKKVAESIADLIRKYYNNEV